MSIVEKAVEEWEKFLNTTNTGFEYGNCFYNSAKFVLVKECFDGCECTLVHGEVEHPKDGTRHDHAWVEWGDNVPVVIDPSTGKNVPVVSVAAYYYRIGKVKSTVRYSLDELIGKLHEEEHYGPW